MRDRARACVRVCVYVYVYVCMYMCMCVCVCVCVCYRSDIMSLMACGSYALFQVRKEGREGVCVGHESASGRKVFLST